MATALTREQQAFVVENKGLAVAYVKKLLRRLPPRFGAFTADIYSSAYVGLCEAVRRFVPGRAAFSTYAYIWITREVFHHIRSMTGAVAFNSHSGGSAEYRNRLDWSEPDVESAVGPESVESAIAAREIMDRVEVIARRSKWKANDVAAWFDCFLADGSKAEMSKVIQKHGVSRQRIHQQKKAVEDRLKTWANVGVPVKACV